MNMDDAFHINACVLSTSDKYLICKDVYLCSRKRIRTIVSECFTIIRLVV